MMATSLNIGSTYKNVSSCGVNIDGVWKNVNKIFTNINGVWKEVYSSFKGKASFDGSSYISLADSDDWYLNNGSPYCYEMILDTYGLDTTTYKGLMNQSENVNSRMTCYMRLNRFIYTVYYSGSYKVNLDTNYSFSNDTTYHIAIVCENSSTWRLYINGLLVVSQTNATAVNYNFAAPLIFGMAVDPTVYWNRYMRGIRITKGDARYMSNFTAPTDFTVDSSNVKLCIKFAEPLGSTTFIDDTGKTVTTSGNVVIIE